MQTHFLLPTELSTMRQVTLVWTDAPAEPAASIALVNDLNLEVTTCDQSSSYWPSRAVGGMYEHCGV